MRILRTLAEVEDIRAIWMAWQSNPISDLDNFLLIARTRPEILRPNVLVVYRDGRPDSVLVGRLERSTVNFQLGYFKVFRGKVRILSLMQGGFLGNQSAENSDALIREILESLRCGEADIARLEQVRSDSPLSAAAKELPGVFSRDYFFSTQSHEYIELPENFTCFVAGISKKERHNLKRFEKRLHADFPGKLEIRCFRREEQIENLLRDAEEIARKTYQRGLGVGFSNGAETRGKLQSAARNGALRGCVLYLDRHPCAFMIGAAYGETLHGDFMGFDPQFGAYAPGSLLLMHWIEEAFQPAGSRRISRIDLGSGDARYKRAICNRRWDESLIYIFAPTFMGLRLNLHRTIACLLHRSAKWLAVKTGVIERVKKNWRLWRRNSGSETESAAESS